MSVDNTKRELSPVDSKDIDENTKRAKLDPELQPETAPAPTQTQTTETPLTYPHTRPGNEVIPPVISKMGLKPILPVMPPSLELVTGVKADLRARKGFVGQEEVGILGYAGDPAFKGVRGVIKQR
jgi:tRNA pseudouridine13 synthase